MPFTDFFWQALYVENGAQKGPVSEAELLAMRKVGAIKPNGLVWRQGMSDWQPIAQALPAETPVAATAPEPEYEPAIPGLALSVEPEPEPERAPEATCRECGGTFPLDEMVPYAGKWICAGCKPLFFQKIQQGSRVTTSFVYGGFWIRFAGKFLDGLIQQGCSIALNFVVMGSLFAAAGDKRANAGAAFGVMAFAYAFPLAYTTFFLGRFGATPGKMACGLRVVRPDGTPITYLRAFGRHFAEILSGVLFCAGYIMAAFDDEKRALHDRICDTRVIRK